MVHGDVFGTPSNSLLLSALVGIGYHVATTALIVCIIASLGTIYMESVKEL